MAERSFSKWYTLYIDTPDNSFEKMDLKLQRYLINNFKMATELGAMSEKVSANDIVEGILEFAKEKGITKIVLGKPAKKGYLKRLTSSNIIDVLLDKVEAEQQDYDVEILA
jgi:two-component system sensor histidine kinase KdpD